MDKQIKVFISYVHEDYDIAEKIYDLLKRQGVEPWMDRESIGAGSDWQYEIKRNIQDSDFFIRSF